MNEKLKQRVIEQCQSVERMSVFKRRLPTDDGWEFMAAEKRPDKSWLPADHQDLVMIAARALTGAF